MSGRVVDAPRLAVQRKEAAEAIGVSGDTFDRHVRPELPCVYVGATRLWRVADLEAWLVKHAVQPVGSDATTENAPATLGTSGGMAQEA